MLSGVTGTLVCFRSSLLTLGRDTDYTVMAICDY